MTKTRIALTALICLSVFASACLVLSLSPDPTPTPTLTPTRTLTPTTTLPPTPSLTPTPLPSPGADISALCIQVKTEYPGKNLTGDIQRVLSDVFGPYGMNLLTGSCDATLKINAVFTVRSAEYKDQDTGKYVTCYTGRSVEGEMVFEKEGMDPVTYKINKKINPPGGTIHTCPKQESHTDLSSAWAEDVLTGLYKIFGPEVLANFIFLGYAGGSPAPAFEAADQLEALGTKAEGAIPVILDYFVQRYGDELPEYDPSTSQALRLLNRFSDQDYGRDVNAWVRWWEEYSE